MLGRAMPYHGKCTMAGRPWATAWNGHRGSNVAALMVRAGTARLTNVFRVSNAGSVCSPVQLRSARDTVRATRDAQC